jgi:hypothetical protein
MVEDRQVATRERTPRSKLERERLRERFVATQGSSPDSASRLVTRIAGADDDIWNAAVTWARSGEMPPAPEIHGHTPATLGMRLRPSQVFTALVGLRTDPRVALHALRYSPDDLPGAARQFEERVAEVLQAAGIAFQRNPGKGPDFVVNTNRGTLLVEAKATRDARRLGPAIQSLSEALLEYGAERALLVVPVEGQRPGPGSKSPVQIIPLARLAEEIELRQRA